VASIAIGCVLAGVAAFMSRETMSLLIGEAASTEVVEGVRGLIEAEAAKSGAIRRIHTIRTMHLGPQDVLATVRIDFEDTVSAARVETIVGDLEGAIKARFPEIHCSWRRKGIEASGRVRFEVVSRTFPDQGSALLPDEP
jgi:divalent metal cation (Fe/Co/Zn/Cd) transporter